MLDQETLIENKKQKPKDIPEIPLHIPDSPTPSGVNNE